MIPEDAQCLGILDSLPRALFLWWADWHRSASNRRGQWLPLRAAISRLAVVLMWVIAQSQFSCSVVSNSLQPHGLQHTRPPCPSPAHRVYSNSCPLSRWCHPTKSSSVVPFSSHLQYFPASGSFQMNQFFASGSQRIGVSASASVLTMNIQDWFPLGCTGSPCSPRDSQESSPTPHFKSINSLALSFLYGPTLTSVHDYWKNHSLD